MAAADKANNEGQIAKGKVKEALGEATDDREIRAEGKADQLSGNLKQAGEKLKDAAKDAIR